MDNNHNKTNLRYWGWGYQDHFYNREKTTRFLDMLLKKYCLATLPPKSPVHALNEFNILDSKLPNEFVSTWQPHGLSLDKLDRLIHATGKSYRDLVRVRSGHLNRFPDGVLFVKTTDDLQKLFVDAQKFKITLIPFGGGTGVVGGTECVGPKENPVLVVALKDLNNIISVDAKAQTVTAQGGILGPELEAHLNTQGFTLGHFPQSFEFSTLGGWVATRSAGQNSTKYGKIEDMVQSLTIHTCRGVIETNHVPASASGPSIKELLIGSEGIYGIITEATLRIHPMPVAQKFVSAFFKDFASGMNAVRHIMQEDLVPSVIRLSDADESSMFLKLMLKPGLQEKIVPLFFKFKKLGTAPCFLLLATEGLAAHVCFQNKKFKALIKKNGGVIINKSFDKKWKKDRFELPYMRDDLMDYGFFIDTLETATSWTKLPVIYEHVKNEIAKSGEDLIMACHLSHAYHDGASLYFTFIGQQKKGQEIEQWEKIKTTATNAIMHNGGTISHHHGVGYDHKRWMQDEQTSLGLEVIKNIKKDLDPNNILNPGKVF